MAPNDDIDLLILGIGNLLWADEGFGVRAVEALHRAHAFGPEVVLMDGGTQGLYLLPYIQAARRVIVFDAVDYGLAPGTLKLVRDADIPAYLGVRKMSLHQSNFQELLCLAQLTAAFPERILLVGVQPADVSDYGGSLTAPVRTALPVALEAARTALREWGVPFTDREAGDALGEQCLAMDHYEQGRPPPELACRFGDARVLSGAN